MVAQGPRLGMQVSYLQRKLLGQKSLPQGIPGSPVVDVLVSVATPLVEVVVMSVVEPVVDVEVPVPVPVPVSLTAVVDASVVDADVAVVPEDELDDAVSLAVPTVSSPLHAPRPTTEERKASVRVREEAGFLSIIRSP